MRELRFAAKQTFPIFFTYLFIGIAFGVMMAECGYSAIWSLVSAVFVFAGSLQIIMVSLLRAGAPLWTVAVMTFFCQCQTYILRRGIYREVQEDGRCISVYGAFADR